jgi:hypothetical protein
MTHTQQAIDQCNAAVSDKACGSRAQALLNCEAANEQCLADGGADQMNLIIHCETLAMDYLNCLLANSPDGGD